MFPSRHGQNCLCRLEFRISLRHLQVCKRSSCQKLLTIYQSSSAGVKLTSLSTANVTTLAEVQVHLYKQKNASCGGIPTTMGSFSNHILCTFHQLRQCKTTVDALLDVRDPLEYGWGEKNDDYIPATTANTFISSFLVELISCSSKKCCKKSCFCLSIGEIALAFVDAASSV